MRKLNLIGFMLASYAAVAQMPSIDAGPDQVLCPPDCVTITAEFVGGGGNTSDYTVEDITYAPDPYAGTAVALSDDGFSELLPIGFDFCFYGQVYNEFLISANGWIGFGEGEWTWDPETIPGAGFGIPKNCIMGPWQDLRGDMTGSIRYQVLGVAPTRRLVVSWEAKPFFSCTDIFGTQQIIIYESSNHIENHIQDKPTCDSWADGRAVQGVHNADGTAAVTYPGRNNTSWTAFNEAIQYLPMGDPTVEWYDEDDVLVGIGPEITLCPDETTTYTARLISCGVELASDEVLVTAVCCEAPVMSHTDVTCFGACDGTGTANPMGLPPFTFLWDAAAGSQTTATAVGLCPGTYTVQVFDAAGCIEEGTVTVTEPDELLFTTDLTHVTCFGGSDGMIIVNVTGGTAPYTYNIGDGVVPENEFGGLSAGTYTVTVTDDNGCVTIQDIEITEDPLPAVSFVVDEVSGCEPLEVTFTNTGDMGVLNEWSYGDGTFSTAFGAAAHIYENFGVYSVSLTVTDADGCSSTELYNDFIEVYEVPEAEFNFSPKMVSTEDPEVEFTDLSISADNWFWDFGGFGNSNTQNPSYVFPEEEGKHEVILKVTTVNGCEDQTERIVTVFQERLIFAPNTITPDGDLFNEVFTPHMIGIDIYDYHLMIYNRWGEIVFESFDLSKGWNGTYGGEVVESGVYVWNIIAADIITDEIHEFIGYVTVLK